MALFDFLNIFFVKIFGIPLIIFPIVIAGYFLAIHYKSKLKEKPELIKKDLNQEIEAEMWERASTFGYVINNLLRVGSNYIGKAKTITPFFASCDKVDFTGKHKRLKTTPEETEISKPYYLIGIVKFGLINILKYIVFKKCSWFITSQRLVDFKTFEIEINPFHEAELYHNVWIFSNEAKEFIDKISFKKTLNEVMESQVNFLPKLAYHENQLSNIVAKLREKAVLEKEKYKGQTESAEEG